MRFLRQNLLIAGLLCIVIGAAAATNQSMLPFGATIGVLGIALFVWGFSTPEEVQGMSQEEIDSWKPKADSLPDAGRVMYRVDTTLYEPKKTTILCGSCGNIAEVDGGRPQMFNCPECGIFLWEDEEE